MKMMTSQARTVEIVEDPIAREVVGNMHEMAEADQLRCLAVVRGMLFGSLTANEVMAAVAAGVDTVRALADRLAACKQTSTLVPA